MALLSCTSQTPPVIDIAESESETETKCKPVSETSKTECELILIDEISLQEKIDRVDDETKCMPVAEISINHCELIVIDEIGTDDEEKDQVENDVCCLDASPETGRKVCINSNTICVDTKPNEETSVEPCSATRQVRNETIPENDLFCIDTKPEHQVKPDTTPETGENDLFFIDPQPDDQEKPGITPEPVGNDLICIDKSPEKVGNNLFCVDTTPEIQKDKERHLGPRYRREFDTVLTIEDEKPVVSPDSLAIKQDTNKCFNCLGDHSVANCPKPRNQQEIFKNRRQFMGDQPNKQLMNQRYHVENNTKYDHLKAGVVSESLRNALGLRSREVPQFIYHMRMMGYPPGWIEETKESSSGIDMVDSPAASRQSANNKVTYDVDKIVDYPGFNVPLDPYFRDDWRYLNFPPMMPAHAKELLIDNLKKHNHYANSCSNQKGSANTAHVDMDLNTNSSIEELEMQRKTLLAELEEGEIKEDSKKETSKFPEEKPADSMKPATTPEAESSQSSDLNEKSTARSPSQSSRLLEMGTPVAIKFSSFNTLPGLDKFALNMGDLELFENLPKATGAFKKMKSLIQKVRKAFKKK